MRIVVLGCLMAAPGLAQLAPQTGWGQVCQAPTRVEWRKYTANIVGRVVKKLPGAGDRGRLLLVGRERGAQPGRRQLADLWRLDCGCTY
jgi:hypothetical protein